jgi:hypothetical protein
MFKSGKPGLNADDAILPLRRPAWIASLRSQL